MPLSLFAGYTTVAAALQSLSSPGPSTEFPFSLPPQVCAIKKRQRLVYIGSTCAHFELLLATSSSLPSSNSSSSPGSGICTITTRRPPLLSLSLLKGRILLSPIQALREYIDRAKRKCVCINLQSKSLQMNEQVKGDSNSIIKSRGTFHCPCKIDSSIRRLH